MRGVLVAAGAVCALVLAGCSTGSDAVVQGGTFQFISPGGKLVITYDPPSSRGTVGNLQGPDLLDQRSTVQLDSFEGQVVVLNVWGQWCGPCRGEANALESVYTSTRPSGVQFLGVNVKDPNISAPQDYVRSLGITYPSIWDPSYRSLVALGGSFPTSTTPATLVLDREHRVAAVFLKAITVEDLQPVVERVAAEQPAPTSTSSPTTTRARTP